MGSLFSVAGKTVLITGSSRGLGYAYAKGYAEAGATVILNGTDAAKLEAAVRSLRGEGHTVFGYGFDVSDKGAVQANLSRIENEVAPIDILINNAGIHRRAPLVDMSDADWRRVIDVNLTSAFLVGQAAAKFMLRRGHGKIINITSLNAELARTNISNYSAAKGGLKMLTKAMATEWGQYGLNVNALGPGYILTDLTQQLADDPAFDAWVKSKVPQGRWGRPEDLVGAAIFLGSDASDYINGQTIYVDGGWQACL